MYVKKSRKHYIFHFTQIFLKVVFLHYRVTAFFMFLYHITRLANNIYFHFLLNSLTSQLFSLFIILFIRFGLCLNEVCCSGRPEFQAATLLVTAFVPIVATAHMFSDAHLARLARLQNDEHYQASAAETNSTITAIVDRLTQ